MTSVGSTGVYDHVLHLGLVPVIELSFMPRDLARNPDTTVFEYGAIVSPPKDWDRWGDLVGALVRHLVERYGLEEVRDRWSFEVWNEANLEVFWSGTQEEYFRLYDVAARAIKDVHPGLVVGGPSSAAAGWIDETLAHVGASGAPLDFRPHIRMARRCSTCGRLWNGTDVRVRRCGGPSGEPRPPISRESATRYSPRLSCCAECAPRRAGSRHCHTGWRPTILKN